MKRKSRQTLSFLPVIMPVLLLCISCDNNSNIEKHWWMISEQLPYFEYAYSSIGFVDQETTLLPFRRETVLISENMDQDASWDNWFWTVDSTAIVSYTHVYPELHSAEWWKRHNKYGKDVIVSVMQNNEILFNARKKIHITKPLEVNMMINDTMYYERSVLLNQEIKITEGDNIRLTWNPENRGDKVLIVLTFTKTAKEIPWQSNQKYYREIIDSMPVLRDIYSYRIRRIMISNDKGQFNLDKSLFDNLQQKQSLSITVYRGKKKDFIRDDKIFTIYNLSKVRYQFSYSGKDQER